MINLSLEEFGSVKSTLGYIIQNNVKGLYYNNDSRGLKIECDKRIDGFFDVDIKESKNKLSVSSYKVANNIKDINSILMKDETPKIRTWYNSGEDRKLNPLQFTVRIPYNNKDVFLNFDKELGIVIIKNTCTAYKMDKSHSIDYNSPVEKYIITDNGYFCYNYKENTCTALYNGIFIDFNFMQKVKVKYGCSILENCPTNIIFNSMNDVSNNYKLEYDSLGVVTTCYSTKEKNRKLCRYETYMEPESKYSLILSIHPLLLDCFDYDNIVDPLKYWCLDKVTLNNGITTVNRTIVEVNKLEDLIKILNEDIEEPII